MSQLKAKLKLNKWPLSVLCLCCYGLEKNLAAPLSDKIKVHNGRSQLPQMTHIRGEALPSVGMVLAGLPLHSRSAGVATESQCSSFKLQASCSSSTEVKVIHPHTRGDKIVPLVQIISSTYRDDPEILFQSAKLGNDYRSIELGIN